MLPPHLFANGRGCQSKFSVQSRGCQRFGRSRGRRDGRDRRRCCRVGAAWPPLQQLLRQEEFLAVVPERGQVRVHLEQLSLEPEQAHLQLARECSRRVRCRRRTRGHQLAGELLVGRNLE